MSPALIRIIIFAVSLIVLIKSSEVFNDIAMKFGQKYQIPSFIIGIVIIAFGTSLPELASSLVAVLEKSSELVVGTIVGSNIANMFLVIGLTAVVVKKIKIHYEIQHVDLPMFAGSAMFFWLILGDGVIRRFESLLCLVGLCIYTGRAIMVRRIHEHPRYAKKTNSIFGIREYVLFLLSLLGLSISAKFTVDSVIMLSELLQIGKTVFAVIPVSVGTSLPELVVSMTAIRKGQSEVAVGNIIGSNIFNIFGIVGITGLFGHILVPPSMLSFGVPVMLAGTVLLIFVTQDKELTVWEGGMLLLFYAFFLSSAMLFI